MAVTNVRIDRQGRKTANITRKATAAQRANGMLGVSYKNVLVGRGSGTNSRTGGAG